MYNRRYLIGIVITIIIATLIYSYYSPGWEVGEEKENTCDSTCKSMNYQYGVCREEAFGCASDELDLGKNKNDCVDANCCCVTGCDYVCKDRGYESGYCNFGSECREGEVDLGSGICKSGWPTTALNLCCCKSS